MLMKRHKEPAPARPPTPALQTRAPAWRGPGALCPGSPAARALPGTGTTKPRQAASGRGVPSAPPPSPGGRAPAHAPLPGGAPARGPRPRPPLPPTASHLVCVGGGAPPAGRPALPAAPRPRRPTRAACARPVRPPPARLGSPPSAPRAPLTAARPAPSWKLVTSAPPAHP